MDPLPIQIYAVQTASFVVLGTIAALLPRSADQLPNARHFGWLAGFGLLRGSLGLLHLWTFSQPPEPLDGVLALVSFFCLFEFARRMASDYGRHTSSAWTPYTSAIVYVPVLSGLMLMLATDGWPALSAGARYLLALPGGLGAAFVLHQTFPWREMERLDRGMACGLVATLAAYGLIAGLFVPPVEGFPVWFPTTSAAHEVTGLPVALLVKTTDIILVSVTLGTLVHRASARAMSDLRRNTLGLEALAVTLESRVAERTADLERQQKFAQHLLDVTPAIILVLSPEGRIQHVNPAFERLTGWHLDEVRGQDWLEQLPARDRPRIEHLFHVAIAGTPTRGNVNPIVTRAGEEREIEWHDQVLRDGTSGVTGLIAVGIDVTDRKRTEQALRESEIRLRAIYESEPECVKIVARDGTLLDMNPAGLRMIGASTLESVRHLRVIDLIEPGYRTQYLKAIEAVSRGETSVDEYEIVTLNGTRRWVEQHAVPMRDPSDSSHVTAILAFTRDVTSRRTMEAELRRSEQRLRQAQTIAVIGNWELDLVSENLWWSDEIFRIFEIDQTQFRASYAAFLDAVHPGDREAVNAAYTGSLATREPYRITHRIQTADGRVKHVEERCETDFAADGAPLRSRGTVQEITVRVETEEALRASVREKETLLREVHHRVKNNLQIVSSLLHFQAKRVKHPDDLAAFADARNRLWSMSLVHEKLYRSSDLSAIDMRDYLRELIAGMQQSLEAASRSITVELTADPIRLSVEAAMPVGMIVGELLTNVFKHAFPADRRNGRVEVSVTVSGSQAEIGVTDNGVGLPETFSPESSESFGWQLVRALTAQLDGEVRVAAGAGTRVVIIFPTGERA